MVAAGGGPKGILTVNDVDDSLIAWSRDGHRVYFHEADRDPDRKAAVNRIFWVEL